MMRKSSQKYVCRDNKILKELKKDAKTFHCGPKKTFRSIINDKVDKQTFKMAHQKVRSGIDIAYCDNRTLKVL